MRYIDFITEICELREEVFTAGRLGPRAQVVFGPDNTRATEHLDFLFDCFDVWKNTEHAQDVFDAYFPAALPGDPAYDWHKVTLFGSADTNLFEQCCHSFDSQRERQPAIHPAAEPVALFRADPSAVGETRTSPGELAS